MSDVFIKQGHLGKRVKNDHSSYTITKGHPKANTGDGATLHKVVDCLVPYLHTLKVLKGRASAHVLRALSQWTHLVNLW